jgi:hypothetical protein
LTPRGLLSVEPGMFSVWQGRVLVCRVTHWYDDAAISADSTRIEPLHVKFRGRTLCYEALLLRGFFLGCGAASAFFAAQRFFRAATIAALPAALSFRFGVEPTAALDSPFDAAHRFRCASAIALRPAALILRLPRRGASEATTGAVRPAVIIFRRSAIWASILRFCSSKPRMAAITTSFVSLGFGMWSSRFRLFSILPQQTSHVDAVSQARVLLTFSSSR